MSLHTGAQANHSISGTVQGILIGSVPACFIAAFFLHFHPQLVPSLVISLASLLVCQFGAVVLLEEILRNPLQSARRNWVVVVILVIVLLTTISAVAGALKFPGLFNRRLLFMGSNEFILFALLAIFTSVGILTLSRSIKGSAFIRWIRSTPVFHSVQGNLPGLLLAVLFFLTYFTIAATVNFPGFRTLDQFFDFDISDWLARLTHPSANDLPVIRPVHPAVLLVLRPLTWFLSLFLNGDRLHALFVLHALTAAMCTYMIWLIAKHLTGNKAYSLIIASLLGASASHLLLGSMVETYIYSAFGLILFSYLIHTGRTGLRFTLPIGLLVSGITISNFVQTVPVYMAGRPSFKLIARYILLAALSIVVLFHLEIRIYPLAHAPLASSTVDREYNYIHIPDITSWKFMGRVSLVMRAITLYSMIAPQPFILSEEIGADGIPHFRTYQITIGQFHVAGYSGFADLAVKFWFVLLVSAFGLFALGFIKSRSASLIPTALLLCLLFNFVLHAIYGDDPMLYSPDWVYALVLFVAHALKPWADFKSLQLILTILLISMIVTNLNLIHQIAEISAPLYGR